MKIYGMRSHMTYDIGARVRGKEGTCNACRINSEHSSMFWEHKPQQPYGSSSPHLFMHRRVLDPHLTQPPLQSLFEYIEGHAGAGSQAGLLTSHRRQREQHTGTGNERGKETASSSNCPTSKAGEPHLHYQRTDGFHSTQVVLCSAARSACAACH